MRTLPDSNLCYPVLIETQEGSGSGSGFYFITDEKVFLVTALHVLFRTVTGKSALVSKNAKLTSYNDVLHTIATEIVVDLENINIRKDDTSDIVLIEVATVTNLDMSKNTFNFTLVKSAKNISKGNIKPVVITSSHLKKFQEVLVSNDVFILGFPNSLGSTGEIELTKPLLRKGVIAGKNLKNNTIILDCPVYFGNSGGIAIEVNDISLTQKEFRVIGVVSKYIPFVEELYSRQLGYKNLNIENSGYSVIVPIDTILELTKEKPILEKN